MGQLPPDDNPSERLSSETIKGLSRFQQDFVGFQKEAEAAERTFLQELDITPQQSDQATKSLFDLVRHIDAFDQFLSSHLQFHRDRNRLKIKNNALREMINELKQYMQAMAGNPHPRTFQPGMCTKMKSLQRTLQDLIDSLQKLVTNTTPQSEASRGNADVPSEEQQKDLPAHRLPSPTSTSEQPVSQPLPPIVRPLIDTSGNLETGQERNEVLRLYNIAKHLEPHDVKLICIELEIEFNSLAENSHEARVLSLVQRCQNQVRLPELEKILQEKLSNHFHKQ